MWAIVKYYDTKKTKLEEQKEIQAKARTEQLNNIANNIQAVKSTNEKQEVILHDLEDAICIMQNDLVLVHNQLQSQQNEIEQNEINRLQTAIIDFADKLRAGNRLGEHNFHYVFDAYEKYRDLGGNSYIESEMDYIKLKKAEFDNNR